MKDNNQTFLNKMKEKNLLEIMEPLEEYKGSVHKIKFKCKVCNNIFSNKPAKILCKEKHCPYCSVKKVYNNEIIDKILKEKNKNIKRIGDYTAKRSKIEWLCLICGNKFDESPDNILESNHGCNLCSKYSKINNELIDYKLIGKNIIRLEDVNAIRDKVLWKCLICENKWATTVGLIINFGVKCPKCMGGKSIYNDLIDKEIKDRNIIRLETVYRMSFLTKWQCQKCNHIWEAKPRDVINKKSGCPLCKKCKNEKLTGIYLEKITGVKPLPHHRIIGPIYNELGEIIRNKIYVDYFFYYNNKQYIIEYNGHQHYQKTYIYWDAENAEEILKNQIIRDKWLKTYCKRNDIKFIEIDGRKYINDKIYDVLKEFFP